MLAQEAAKLDALLIHYSTDYVFDGEKPGPYLESDPISPLGVYGASKAAGEAAIAAAGSRYLVLRTSWVYSAHGKNFLRTMLRLGAERPELRVVDDQVGAPTSAAAIAAATVRLLEQPAVTGIYHMTAADSTSWYGFARAILRQVPWPPSRGYNRFHPLTIQHLPGGLPTQCCPTTSSPNLRFPVAHLARATATGLGRDAGGTE